MVQTGQCLFRTMVKLEVGKEVGVSRREGEQDWQPARVEQVDASIALGKCVGLVWREGKQDWQPARVEQVDASIALGK